MPTALRGQYDLILPLASPYYEAIGRVAAQWAYLERSIDEHLQFLWLYQKAATLAPLNLQERFGKRTARWIELARCVYNAPHVLKIQQIAGKANNIKPARDAVVHGGWSRDDEKSIFMAVYRGARFIDHRPMPVTEIRNTARTIAAINAEFARYQLLLMNEYGGLPLPAPNPPPEQRS